MKEQANHIPDTADGLIAKIDQSKAEKVSPQLVDELRQEVLGVSGARRRKGTYDADLGGFCVESKLRLVDGSMAIVKRPALSHRDEKFSAKISLIARLTDKHGTAHVANKEYSLFASELQSNLSPVINFDQFDSEDPDLYEDLHQDEINEEIASSQDPRAGIGRLAEHWNDGVELDQDTGIYEVSNEEALNLIRLLRTSEPLHSSSVH